MSWVDAFIPVEIENRRIVKENTWGHLAPKKNKEYAGFILFCYASDGTLCPIDYNFSDLPSSPWLYDAIIDFIDENIQENNIEQCKVYKFIGTFYNYTFKGKIQKIDA